MHAVGTTKVFIFLFTACGLYIQEYHHQPVFSPEKQATLCSTKMLNFELCSTMTQLSGVAKIGLLAACMLSLVAISPSECNAQNM